MARDFCPMFQLYGVFFYATIINNFNLFNLPSTLLRLTYVFLIAHSLLIITFQELTLFPYACESKTKFKELKKLI